MSNSPVTVLSKDEIKDMKPNVPTRRVYGTDASLDWPQQLEQIRKACSKAVTRLYALLDSVSAGAEVADIVRALSNAQSMALKATGHSGGGDEPPSDSQVIKAAKQ
jgi:hypothetical protein